MTKKVLVLGGGVAGMSAAHELAERDFEVVVLEARPIAGGKARSMPVPGSGTDGRRDLPGEHGFRFFPGFYRHLPDTMRRIPFGGERDGVLSNLVPATRVQMARAGGAEIVTPSHLPAIARRARPRLPRPSSPTPPSSASRPTSRLTSSIGCCCC